MQNDWQEWEMDVAGDDSLRRDLEKHDERAREDVQRIDAAIGDIRERLAALESHRRDAVDADDRSRSGAHRTPHG